jgi:phage portal protein BeeE
MKTTTVTLPKWMSPKWWLVKLGEYQYKKSLSYRVLVSENQAGRPYHEAHSDEDKLASELLFPKVPAIYAGITAISSAIAMVPIRVLRRN